MTDELLTAEEVADRLRVKPDTIIGWAREGRIPAHRLSRKVIRFRFDDLVAALEREVFGDQARELVPRASEG
jgi:excisionase family DNA binding protein